MSRAYWGKALDEPLFPGWLGVVVKAGITVMLAVLFANVFAAWFS